MTDVKLSHYFLLTEVINREDVFLTLKLFRKQFQSTTCLDFNLNVLRARYTQRYSSNIQNYYN